MAARLAGPIVFAIALAGGIAAVAVACADDPHLRTPPGKLFGGGGACEAKPGELPEPNCDNSSKACAPVPGCHIDEQRCGSTSTCMPAADHSGKDVVDLRIRRLNIAAPPALASTFIQNTIVNSGIELAEPACAEKGRGLFSWLLRIDRRRLTAVTGGAPPAVDPFGQGYCFADFELDGVHVAPITIQLEQLPDGTYRSVDRQDVNIPIFLSEELSSAIILPIRDARVEGVALSTDGNCIGSFHPAALDPSCTEDRTLCPKWTTAGALGGFITLEEADDVKIRDLNDKSLCAFLASESGIVCGRDANGKILFEGDYCSDGSTPGCRDSVWLAGTFAASAVHIFDGAGSVAGCSGAQAVDGGLDASRDGAD